MSVKAFIFSHPEFWISRSTIGLQILCHGYGSEEIKASVSICNYNLISNQILLISSRLHLYENQALSDRSNRFLLQYIMFQRSCILCEWNSCSTEIPILRIFSNFIYCEVHLIGPWILESIILSCMMSSSEDRIKS